jgi:hypothetical protein
MARKLLVALWRYVETGVVPEGVELKAQAGSPLPGRRSAVSGERDRLPHWRPDAAAFQVGRASTGAEPRA